MKRRAVSNIIAEMILIFIAIVASFAVFEIVYSRSSRISSGPGVSIASATVSSIPGGSFVSVSVVNTGSEPENVSVGVYYKNTLLGSYSLSTIAPGSTVSGQWVLSYSLQPGQTVTLVVTARTPTGSTATVEYPVVVS